MNEEPEIEFNPELHEYKIDGVNVPSVTTILRELGFVDFSGVPPIVLDQARARGNAIHAALHYLQEGDLDETSVDPKIRPYLDAYLLFCADTGWKANLIEHRVYSECFRYAGTLDGLGKMPGLRQREALIDLKSGVPLKAAALQCAAYAIAIGNPYIPRYSVHLQSNGRYKLIPHRNIEDIATWKTIMSFYHLRESYRS